MNIWLDPQPSYLAAMQMQAESEGRQCLVGALVVNQRGRVFVQKRAPGRQLFPNLWDIAGGHVEPGETLTEALARELEEETGWHLLRLRAIVGVFDWDQGQHGFSGPVREFDFLVEVEGDLDHPRIERDKFTAFHWVGMDDLDLLAENRALDDRFMQILVQRGLVLAKSFHLGDVDDDEESPDQYQAE